MRFFKKPISVLYLLLSIVLISIAFQNCSSPFEANSSASAVGSLSSSPGDENTAAELKSLEIFEKTLYNDIQQSCASCHAAVQDPKFAVADSMDSHTFLFDKEYVNLETPENSYLAIKIRAGHNNFPVALAEQFTESVASWAEQLEAALNEMEESEPEPEAPVDPEPEAPVEPPVEPTPVEPVPEVNEKATFSYIYENVLAPKCLSCHKPREAGGFGLKDNYTSFATTLATGSVVPGDSSASSMYVEIVTGKMPPTGSVDPADLAGIREWIDAGAENN